MASATTPKLAGTRASGPVGADVSTDALMNADGWTTLGVDPNPPEGMAHDTLAFRLADLTLPGIEIPVAASPTPATFADLGAGMPWRVAMGGAVTAAIAAPADAPVTLQATAQAPVATNSAALPAPQVLASGTWLANPQITVKTSLGNIVAELFPNAAPVTSANCLAHVSSGFYDDLLFHRVVAGFVVQGGGFATGQVYQTPPYAPIVLESNNGLFNSRGTLAMARTDDPNSATSQFFINVVDNKLGNVNNLDFVSASRPGYAVFGKVLTGLSVVDAIGAVPAPAPSNAPLTEVRILEADQTKQGTLHSTTGRIDLGLLAADDTAYWTGKPSTAWEYSLNAGASWAPGPNRSFTVPQGAYEVGSIQVRYIGPQGTAGLVNGTGGNMIVDSRAILAGDGSANTLTGTSATNVMYGLGGNDTLDGGSGNDSMIGGSGNDSMIGGSGNDSMIGGSGNDSYVVQDSGDKAVEAASGGTDRVNASVTFTLPSNIEQLTLTGASAINGSGNTLSNTITGNSAANSLSGGDGNDTLFGVDGNDTLTGGNGNDLLDGGNGNDSLSGGAGNDRYVVQGSADKVVEASGGGTDSVSSGTSHTLAAEVEHLTLTGGLAANGSGNALSNRITGNTAINTLNGGSGNDVLDGGGGNDNLSGSTGLDTFRFSSALNASSNVDSLLDFNVADDRLELENAVFTQLGVTGALSSSNFVASTTGNAVDSNDHVLYETDTGRLFYDADGSGAALKVLFATLQTLPVLTSADIFVT